MEGQEKVIVGAGRLDFGTILDFKGDNGLRVRNCRRLTLCNMWISARELTGEGAAIEIAGESPCEVNLLNTMIEGHIGLKVRAPAEVRVQGCHFFGGDPGLLVAHPKASVTVLGGNFQSEIVHIRQTAGHLEAYGIGFQIAKGGADIELNTASAKPFIIAACRTEGPEYLLRTPDTAEKIDVVVKACSLPGTVKFVRYGAAGTLTLFGSNCPRGIEASTSPGTVWSIGNTLGTSFGGSAPYQIGPKGQVLALADLWGTLKPDDPYREPGNAFITPDMDWGEGPSGPAKNVRFLQTEAPMPSLEKASVLTPVPMPAVANIVDLIPSVKSSGAAGDGKTDDTAALQQAIEANRKGPLYFPPGEYHITKPLFLDHRNGGWFVGAGKEKTLIVNTAGGAVLTTDGCGYAAFQDLAFVAAEGADAPAFDLSWDQRHKAPPDFLGSALQANIFHRCRFVGGAVGLSIGREGYMGSESLLVDCEFVRCKIGLAVCNYNALSNNAVRCLFQDNEVAVAQASAGSFNVFDSRIEGSKQTDFKLGNSAGDCFYVSNTTSTSPRLLNTGNTGAVINVLFDGFRYVGQQPITLTSYNAGGSVLFLYGDLGEGTLAADGSIANKALVLLGTQYRSQKVFQLGGRAKGFLLVGKGREP